MAPEIRSFMEEQVKNNALRELVEVSPAPGGRVIVGGKEYLNLSSNDYLGLSCHALMASEIIRSLSGSVVTSPSSRLLTGTTPAHTVLENRMAEWKAGEAALIFNSGYQANIGIISAIAGRKDVVFADRLVHASMVDGARLSGAKLIRFRHNDMEHLSSLLEKERSRYDKALILTESVFSMDGDMAPLAEVTTLKERFDCLLMVDEAHATGVFGRSGAGMMEAIGYAARADIIMGTFSKAIAGFGAYAVLSEAMRAYLVNSCRSFIYTTALPVYVVAANMAGLDLVQMEPWRRKTLLVNADILRRALTEEGCDTRGNSQIIPIITGGNDRTMRISAWLRRKGYWVAPVRPPTVPDGGSRIRVSLSAEHTSGMLERFARDMGEALKKNG